MRSWWKRAATCLLAAMTVGCAGAAAPAGGATTGSPAPTAGAPAALTPSPRPSVAPTSAPPTPSPTLSQPTRFASALYPYALTMPAGSLTLNWHAATTPWDESQRFDLLGPSVDRSSVADGGLLLVGGPAPSGLKAFSDLGVAKANVHHTCTPPAGEHQVTIRGIPGTALTQSCAGQILGRVTMVRNGQGLIAFVWVNSGFETVALGHLIAWLDAGLDWTAG